MQFTARRFNGPRNLRYKMRFAFIRDKKLLIIFKYSYINAKCGYEKTEGEVFKGKHTILKYTKVPPLFLIIRSVKNLSYQTG